MKSATPVIARDERILGGDPVFPGTRVLIRSLFEYLEGGESLEAFLEQFPNVRSEQAVAVLREARRRLVDET